MREQGCGAGFGCQCEACEAAAMREGRKLKIKHCRELADRAEKEGRFTADMRADERNAYGTVERYVASLRDCADALQRSLRN